MITLDYTNENFNYIDENIKVGDICAFGYKEKNYQGVWIGKYCHGTIGKFCDITLENEIFIYFAHSKYIDDNYLSPNSKICNTCNAQTMIRKVNKQELLIYCLVRKLNNNKKGIPFADILKITNYLRKKITIQFKTNKQVSICTQLVH